MRYLYLILAIIIFIFVIVKLTNYEERMTKHNKYMCATQGFEEDCKTLLPEDRRLK